MRRVSLSILALSAVLLAQHEAGRRPIIPAAAAASPGDWRITAKTDSVTGRKVANILLRSSKTAHDGLYFAPNAVMQLGCLKGQPLIHVMFGFQIGSKADSEISYRFDEKPPHEVEARILRGLKIVVIEDKAAAAQFLSELATANVLYLVISSLAKGRTSVEFHVSGAEAALHLISAVCPLSPSADRLQHPATICNSRPLPLCWRASSRTACHERIFSLQIRPGGAV